MVGAVTVVAEDSESEAGAADARHVLDPAARGVELGTARRLAAERAVAAPSERLLPRLRA